MTLIISTLTSSGIILTADSRQTYRNRAGGIRIGSDSALKLYKLTDFVGVSISGKAFLSEQGQPAKDVGYFINCFKQIESLKELTVKEIADKLNKYLGGLFIENDTKAIKEYIGNEIKKLGGKDLNFATPDGTIIPYTYTDKEGKVVSLSWILETINMIVAGIDKDKIGRAYIVYVPKGITNESNTQQCGALWCGQTDVLVRIIKGIAPEAERLDFVKELFQKNKDSVTQQTNQLEYLINWSTMTLQDAIDFCVLMTRTTESIQRFSDGTLLAPGGITGVGGEIDIAVITPEKGFCWLKRKKLESEGADLSLEYE